MEAALELTARMQGWVTNPKVGLTFSLKLVQALTYAYSGGKCLTMSGGNVVLLAPALKGCLPVEVGPESLTFVTPGNGIIVP